MKRKCFIVFLLFFLILLPNSVYAKEINISSKNAILYNLNDNEIIYSKNINDKIYIASLTKILTTIVAIENIKDLNDTITVKSSILKSIPSNLSQAGFKANEKITYLDLLYGIMLPSGADAAKIIANEIAGSEMKFVELMNKKINDLGLKNTHFVNTTGQDNDQHYSSVYDMSIILQYALQNETFKKLYESKNYTATNGLKMESSLSAISKKYNIDISYITGSKTGSTKKAGLCLSSVANNNNINFLLVTANAPYALTKRTAHIIDSKNIYEYYFNNYSYQDIIKENALLTTIKVQYANISNLKFYSDKTISKYLPNDAKNNLDIKYDGVTNINYKTKKGTKLGTYTISYNKQIIYKKDVILNKILFFSLFAFLKDNPIILILTVLIIITLFLLIIKIKRKFKKRYRYKRKRILQNKL